MTGKEYLLSKKWGVFNHYLEPLQGDVNKPHNQPFGKLAWSDLVDCFDVERLAWSLHQMNAGYYFITLMQGTKSMLAPNATFDRIAGTKPGEACARRDLPMELADALSKYNIDLCLYYTGDGPWKDDIAGSRFGFTEPRKDISMDFCKKWASVLEEYAERYGYKDHVKVDADSKLILDYEVTPANVHDSNAFEAFFGEEDQAAYADSAYVGKELPKHIRNEVCEKGYRNKPLTEEQKENNRRKSKVRCRIEHVFGFMTVTMHGLTLRSIGFSRARFNIGLTNLVYNLCRFAILSRKAKCKG